MKCNAVILHVTMYQCAADCFNQCRKCNSQSVTLLKNVQIPSRKKMNVILQQQQEKYPQLRQWHGATAQ